MPAKRVFLHIGAPKTGTTYLQAMLSRNRDALAEAGVHYPDFGGEAHHKAAWDLRGVPRQREGIAGISGAWQRLVEDIEAAPMDSLVSSEHFLFAKPRNVRRALSAFSAEIHIIYTARDLVRQVPAVWQERIKNQEAIRFGDFVAAIMDGGTGAPYFWRSQDAPEVLREWSTKGQPERTHVVTAPPAGSPPTVLWDRFIRALGVDGASFDTSDIGSTNTSLTLTQTEVLRRFNARFGTDVPWVKYRSLIRGELQEALGAITDDRKVSLTESERTYLAEQATRITTEISAAGYDVVGDLGDLVPASLAAGSGPAQPDLTDDELLSAALDVIHALVSRQTDADPEARGAKRRRKRRAAVTDA